MLEGRKGPYERDLEEEEEEEEEERSSEKACWVAR